MEYTYCTTFLLRNHTLMWWRNYSRLFWKKQNWDYFWMNYLKFYTTFSLHGNLRAIEISWNQAADHCFYLIWSFFEKTKSSLELVSLPHFLHCFWWKTFILLYSINGPNFFVWLPLIHEILSNMCTLILC